MAATSAASSLSTKQFLGASSATSDLGSFHSTSSASSSRLLSLRLPERRHPPHPKRLEIKAAGSTFGNFFRVTTFGESHGGGVGCIVDGCPPRIPISEADLQRDLDRRRPGQSRITTPRKETDECSIKSGIAEGVTTGTPIMIIVPNTDQRGHDYSEMSKAYRPSHADYVYDEKYGVRSIAGGGRSSARETIGRVAAGAIAKKVLKLVANTEILAYVSQVHKVILPDGLVDHETLTLDEIESNIVRCPNPEYAEKMIRAIDAVRTRGDSIGGVVTCIARNVPRGLGSPVFDKLEAELAKACLSLPATKGFEFGSGFAGTFLTGSEHNDEFHIDEHGLVRTRTNRSGGIQGGISNGEIINMRVAFKPTATISRKQNTVTRDKNETELIARGRHDPCVVPRGLFPINRCLCCVFLN
ncbi:OLC1v1025983C1 [Oldenlandia corymbosa var. corymbosa]|uniref:Chorismate synthase n=1 Tax=Oldenlandia corymbosa var. corymbosa TaxID=529605 RepID=A0AAV1C923_OLDCO|nr:OLC1v1025983C1 [Oldenlandia corymbosa var. corymbosa]